MKILYNLASRSRPFKLKKCIENIISLAKHDDYIILLTLDVDDITVATKEFYETLEGYGEKVKPVYGFSKSKIDAINKNVWMVGDAGIICNHSDDMVFTKEGFDLDIIEAYANGFSGLAHFPDGHSPLCTYSIMDKKYYDRFGYIYYPEYKNVYCDNDQEAVARILNQYRFINKDILDHQHFAWGFGTKDAQLIKTENPKSYAIDNATFERRKKRNFDL